MTEAPCLSQIVYLRALSIPNRHANFHMYRSSSRRQGDAGASRPEGSQGAAAASNAGDLQSSVSVRSSPASTPYRVPFTSPRLPSDSPEHHAQCLVAVDATAAAAAAAKQAPAQLSRSFPSACIVDFPEASSDWPTSDGGWASDVIQVRRCRSRLCPM